MSIVTIAAVGTAAVLLASLMKGVKAEYGFFLAAAAGMFIFFYGIQKLDSIIHVIGQIQEAIRLDNVYFATLMKMVGITYIGEFASGIWEVRLKYSANCPSWPSVPLWCLHCFRLWKVFWHRSGKGRRRL